MKAFYTIHILVILEVLITIFLTTKLNNLSKKIEITTQKTEKEFFEVISRFKEVKEKVHAFNENFSQKMNFGAKIGKNILCNILIPFTVEKIFLHKFKFFKKLTGFKTGILCFLGTYLFFNMKKPKSTVNLL